jgi:hypothetical protein
MNFLSFFKKPTPKLDSNNKDSINDTGSIKNNDDTNTYVDIVISLTKNLEVNLSLWIDDDINTKPMSYVDYALLCSEFFNNINTQQTKSKIIDILTNQIKTSKNNTFISSIITLMNYADTLNEDKDNYYIKPSSVFTKYTQ